MRSALLHSWRRVSEEVSRPLLAQIVPIRALTAVGKTGIRHPAATAETSRPRIERRTANTASTASAPRYEDLLNEYATPATSTAIAAATANLAMLRRVREYRASSTHRARTKMAPSLL